MSQESQSLDHQCVQQTFVQHKLGEILLGQLLFSEVGVFDLLGDCFVVCCVPALEDINNDRFRLLFVLFAFGLGGSSGFLRFLGVYVVKCLSDNIVDVHDLNITAQGLLHLFRQRLAARVSTADQGHLDVRLQQDVGLGRGRFLFRASLMLVLLAGVQLSNGSDQIRILLHFVRYEWDVL